MALLTVKVGDRKFIVDSDNKGTAKAYGRSKIDVEVSDASAADVQEYILNGNTIERVEPVKKGEAAPAEAEQAAAA